MVDRYLEFLPGLALILVHTALQPGRQQQQQNACTYPHKGKKRKQIGITLQRQPDIRLAKDVLGWQPRTGLEDGLRETIAWFRKLLAGQQSPGSVLPVHGGLRKAGC